MKIVILGAGHMGSWLARELSGENEVAVYEIDEKKLAGLRNVYRLGHPSKIKEFRPELLVNAVSLQHTVAAFEETASYLRNDCIICDVASVKGEIAEYYRKAWFRFASTHPMFGPTFADMETLKEENAVIITDSCSEGREFFQRFFLRLKVRIFEYSFEEHDRMMAYSLTMPFVSSMIFAACVSTETVPGTTFKRHMEIARHLLSEDDQLLSEILFNPHSLLELNRITYRLEFLKHIISGRDHEELGRFFSGLRENISSETAVSGDGSLSETAAT
jgi:prephenate dehydrogenase